METLESGRAALSCIKWMWVADVTKIKPLRQSSHSSSISMIECLGQWRKYLTGKIITLRALMELSSSVALLSFTQLCSATWLADHHYWPEVATPTSYISCWAYFKFLCISSDYRHSGHAIFFISHEKLREEGGMRMVPLSDHSLIYFSTRRFSTHYTVYT